MTLAAGFLGFVVAMLTFVLVATWRFQPWRTALAVTLVLGVWLTYAGALAHFGVLRDTSLRPPGAAFLLLPVLLFVPLFLVRSGAALRLATGFPLWLLIATQTFRIPVELFIHQLWRAGLVPHLMTYGGGNIDIAAGLTAPLVAWLWASGRVGARGLLAWNFLGLATLANIAVRAVLTAPGPLHLLASEVPNAAVGMFPFVYIAGFFAPLAVTLHVLAIRAARAGLRARRTLAVA